MAVFCGGTLKAFVVPNQLDDYLRFLERYRIEYAEVSNGSFRMPLREKCQYIGAAALNLIGSTS
jgi:phosphosulfolactate synthase